MIDFLVVIGIFLGIIGIIPWSIKSSILFKFTTLLIGAVNKKGFNSHSDLCSILDNISGTILISL